MGTLQWDKRLETGIDEVDNQHKEIFKRIADFGLAILKGKEKSELIKLIGFLNSYAIEHFDAEEKIMRGLHHPEIRKHLEEHDQFRNMCKELAYEYRNKGVDQYLALQTEKKLRKWWENHILKLDMSFAPQAKNRDK